MVSPQEFEDAQAQVTTARGDLADATSRLRLLQRGARREERDATKAQIDRLDTQRQFLASQLDLLDVVSPVAGVVATPSRELHAMRGQLVGKGALLAKVYEVRTVTAQIVVPEKEIADVRVGQRVALRSRAYPDDTFEGTVTAIATSAEGTSSADAETAAARSASSKADAARMFIVTTRIENRAQLLKPGMTGQAKISVGEKPVYELIERRLARTFKVEFWSWW